MKRLCLIAVFLIFTLLLVSCSGFTTTQDDVKTDAQGLTYTLNADGRSYTLTGAAEGVSGAITVDTVDGLPVTAVGARALRGTSILSVTMAESVISIGDGAFQDCEQLTDVSLSSQLMSLGSSVFSGCTALKTYTFEGACYLGNPTQPCVLLLYVSDKATASLSLPAGLRVIDGYALQDCAALQELTVPEGVVSIGNFAFSGCIRLSRVSLPDTLTGLGSNAFFSCGALTELFFGGTAEDFARLATGSGLSDAVERFFGKESTPETDVHTHTSASPVRENEVAADCDTDGSYDLVTYCATCGEELSRVTTTLPATGAHTAADAVRENEVAADCDTDGSYDLVTYCATCGEELSREAKTLPATGAHTAAEAVRENEVAATCGESGSYDLVTYCATCGEELSREAKTLPATGVHTYYNSVCRHCRAIPSESVGLYFTLNDDASGYTVSGYGSCADTDIFVPRTYKGLPVTGVDLGCFIFSGDSELCDRVTSLHLHEGVVQVSLLGHSMSRITVDEANPRYKSVEGSLYSKDGKELLFYACEGDETCITIPDGVEIISFFALVRCTSMVQLKVPSSLRVLGSFSLGAPEALEYTVFENGIYLGNNSSALSVFIGLIDTSAVSVTIPEGTVVLQDGALQNCTKLETVYLPDSLRYIGDNVFSGCTALTDVVFGQGLTHIGSTAFSSCHSLESLHLPETVTSIGTKAFYNCTSLSKLYLPDALLLHETAPLSLLRGCDSLVYTIYGGGRYLGSESNPYLLLVDVVDRSLSSLTVHADTRWIYEGACTDCAALSEVVLPPGLLSVGANAFFGCSSLAEIDLPETLVTVGAAAFGSSGLTSVTLPKNVASIGQDAFLNCFSLQDISVAAENEQYLSVEGHLYNGTGTVLLQYAIGSTATRFTVPNGVRVIADKAAKGARYLQALSLPEGLLSIGMRAFEGADLLVVDRIPDTVTSIGLDAFTNYRQEGDLYYVDTWVVGCASYLNRDVYVREGTVGIADGAFSHQGGIAIRSLLLPNGIRHIGADNFCYIDTIASINMPASLVSIAPTAFSNQAIHPTYVKVTKVEIENISAWCRLMSGADYPCGTPLSQSTSVYIENLIDGVAYLDADIRFIPSFTFDKTNATSVYIGSSVDMIDNYAFGTSGNLQQILYEGTAEQWDDICVQTYNEPLLRLVIEFNCMRPPEAHTPTETQEENRTEPTCEAVGSCDLVVYCSVCGEELSRETVTLPATGHTPAEPTKEHEVAATCVTEGSYDAVVYCGGCNEELSRQTVITPPSDAHAYGADGICTVCGKRKPSEGLRFEENTDGGYTVSGLGTCQDVVLVIPDEYCGLPVTRIGVGAFENENALTAVYLPSTVIQIGGYAFSGCAQLTTVTVTQESRLKQIASYAFMDAVQLSSFSVPDSVEKIGDYAFHGCRSLQSVLIREGSALSIISAASFAGCAIEEIYLPSQLQKVEVSAFYNCQQLKRVIFADGETELMIYPEAFSDCVMLTEFVLPARLTSIAGTSLRGCASLVSIGLSEDNGSFSVIDGDLYNKTGSTLVRFAPGKTGATVRVPDGVLCIGGGAFAGCATIEQVVFPDTLVSIEAVAFLDCSSLKAISLGSSVQSVGLGVFMNTAPMTDIYYAGSQKQWSAITVAEGNNEVWRSATVHFEQTLSKN